MLRPYSTVTNIPKLMRSMKSRPLANEIHPVGRSPPCLTSSVASSKCQWMRRHLMLGSIAPTPITSFSCACVPPWIGISDVRHPTSGPQPPSATEYVPNRSRSCCPSVQNIGSRINVASHLSSCRPPPARIGCAPLSARRSRPACQDGSAAATCASASTAQMIATLIMSLRNTDAAPYDPVVLPSVAVSRDPQRRLTALVERCEGDPTTIATARAEGDALAIEIEGDLGLRWRMAVVHALIAHPPDGDAVREYYGELVDRYRDDPPRLAQLKAIGDEIRKRESSGELPSAMVARSDRRRKP